MKFKINTGLFSIEQDIVGFKTGIALIVLVSTLIDLIGFQRLDFSKPIDWIISFIILMIEIMFVVLVFRGRNKDQGSNNDGSSGFEKLQSEKYITKLIDFANAATEYYKAARSHSMDELAKMDNAKYKLKELQPIIEYAPTNVRKAIEEIHANDHGDLAQWMKDSVGPVFQWINELRNTKKTN